MAGEDALVAREEASLADLKLQEYQELPDEDGFEDDATPSLVMESSWFHGIRGKKPTRPSVPVGRALLILVAALCAAFAIRRIAAKCRSSGDAPAEGPPQPPLFGGVTPADGEGAGLGFPFNRGPFSFPSDESSSPASGGGPRLPSDTYESEGTADSEAQNKVREGVVVAGLKEPKAASGQADGRSAWSGSDNQPSPAASAGEKDPRAAGGAGALLEPPNDTQLVGPEPQTFLGSIVPSFSGPPISAADLREFVREKEGAEAASGLEALMHKQLPPENTLPFNTEALSSTMLEIRKQQLLSMAHQCFALRREREQRYLAWRLMEKTLPLLEKNCEGIQQPQRLADLLESYAKSVDLGKERREVMRVKLAYEECLTKERVALDQLFYFLNEMAGHLAAVELFVIMDTSVTEWKEKVPRFKDAASALNELKTLAGSDLLSSGPGMLSLATSTVNAKKQLFASDTAAFKAVAKLADIVKKRKEINRCMRLALDPQNGNLDEGTSGTLQRIAYDFTGQLENMQAETRIFLSERRGQPLDVDPWHRLCGFLELSINLKKLCFIFSCVFAKVCEAAAYRRVGLL
ncbi:hypothetical protein Esti_005627 [Eimeria stiedai]